jgi:hypothetical protein
MRKSLQEVSKIGVLLTGLVIIASLSVNAGTWVNATGNLANMGSECGNLQMVQAVPNSDKTIAVVSAAGFWVTTNGTSWTKMGGSSGASITNRGGQFIFDPSNANTFWECGIYHAPGIVKTTDGGTTFTALGGIWHNDGMAVDFSDPLRLTLLAGGHETSQKLYKSVNGGASFIEIGNSLPAGTGFSSYPYIYSTNNFIMTTTAGWGGGTAGIFRSVNGGTSWTQVSSENVGTPAYATSQGTVFFGKGGGLVRGNADGTSWTSLSCGATGAHPIAELPNNKLAILTSSNISISSDNGSTWSPAISNLPVSDASGITYNSVTGAFYIWRWDCGSVVLSNAIWRYDTMMQTGLNVYALSANPASLENDKSTSVSFSVHASTSTGSISTVTIDLSSVGGGSAVAMTKGTGDLYSASFTVASGLAVGTKTVTVTATDNSSNTKTASASVLVTAPAGPLQYYYLYADTSVMQANIGWYGNGTGNNAAATGCAAAEISTGAYEGTKCIDFTYAVTGWWAGFGVVWNNYNFTADMSTWDTLVFYYKTESGVQFKVNPDCGTTGTPANGITMMFGGTGSWARASIPIKFFQDGGYSMNQVVGFNAIIQGTSATSPASGHVSMDNIFLVGSGNASMKSMPFKRMLTKAKSAGLTDIKAIFDLRGRSIRPAFGLKSNRMTKGIVVAKSASGAIRRLMTAK